MAKAAAQQYEDYWRLTLEYTDFNGDKFIGTLKIIIDFIDSGKAKSYNQEVYEKLQQEIVKRYPKKDMASVRKSINEFVKLGFVEPFLKSYNPEVHDFLNAKTDGLRTSIISRIIYTSSSFNSSISSKSQDKHINFLLKTLEEVGSLSSEDLAALMTVDIGKIHKGYLNKKQLDKARFRAIKSGFKARKYNQHAYLKNLLNKLDDLKFIGNALYFSKDAPELPHVERSSSKRDGYLQRLYKNQLEEETIERKGRVTCMVEDLDYPALIASHIKPFSKTKGAESFDPNNGLLLSKNFDSLFDLGYISFDDTGKVIVSSKLSKPLKKHLLKYYINNDFLNKNRKKYLKYHRENELIK